MGCDKCLRSKVGSKLSFNPRTHVWCDLMELDQTDGYSTVSIHAPTWGATALDFVDFDLFKFQSTHPRGVRLPNLKQYIVISVSIHAPTWGATVWKRHNRNPKWFQSTHPRGVRPPNPRAHVPDCCFNPRTHVGCDLRNELQTRPLPRFQSTHPRGVRLYAT